MSTVHVVPQKSTSISVFSTVHAHGLDSTHLLLILLNCIALTPDAPCAQVYLARMGPQQDNVFDHSVRSTALTFHELQWRTSCRQ